ncbi:MAG: caspase family protein, partial [Sphingomonadaceae bacterium]
MRDHPALHQKRRQVGVFEKPGGVDQNTLLIRRQPVIGAPHQKLAKAQVFDQLLGRLGRHIVDQQMAVFIDRKDRASDYAAIPDLPNALSDADVMARFLRSQGYDVRHHEDITKRGFEDVLRRALFDVDKDTEVVVFFAGHGFQIGSENYLVPVDADLDTVYDIPFEAVSLGSLVNIIGARARLQVVILDSCRDNPFAGKAALTQLGSDLREAKTGFASLAAPLNSMLIYSTSPGAL